MLVLAELAFRYFENTLALAEAVGLEAPAFDFGVDERHGHAAEALGDLRGREGGIVVGVAHGAYSALGVAALLATLASCTNIGV